MHLYLKQRVPIPNTHLGPSRQRWRGPTKMRQTLFASLLTLLIAAIPLSNVYAQKDLIENQLTVESVDTCRATYSVEAQTLTMPCVEVSGEAVSYAVQMQQVAGSEALAFNMIESVEQATSVNNGCQASYALDSGKLSVPCVDIVNPSGDVESREMLLWGQEGNLRFVLGEARSNRSRLRSSSNRRIIASHLFDIPLAQIDGSNGANYGYNPWKNIPSSDCGYRGGHTGIDIQTKDVAGNKTATRKFYAVSEGKVITAGGDRLNTIAIYDASRNITTIYLHARSVFVSKGNDIDVGEELGIQGDKGSPGAEHVHIEVRSGKKSNAACQASDTLNPETNILVYLDKDKVRLELDSEITVEPNPVIQGKPVTIRAKISNRGGTKDFRGNLFAAFHKKGDSYSSQFDITLEDKPLGKGQDYEYTFRDVINLRPGEYDLYIKGDDFQALPRSATYLQNPITVRVISGDSGSSSFETRVDNLLDTMESEYPEYFSPHTETQEFEIFLFRMYQYNGADLALVVRMEGDWPFEYYLGGRFYPLAPSLVEAENNFCAGNCN
jgi:murein DD-endopeptidase MepM/ murein hydrolase activator NlpD